MRAFAIAVLMVAWLGQPSRAEDRINAVIGDVAGGHGEQERIRAHLTYVLGKLREVSGREHTLDALERYIARGEFPRRTHDGFVGRRPRFIDDRGVHCAVGYLIAASGEPALARAINAAHEYDYVRDIHEPALLDWAARHHLTIDELAMIQPTYHGEPPIDEQRIKQIVARSKDTGTLACAQKAQAPAKVVLHFRGKDDHLTVTSGDDQFAKCLAKYFEKINDHHDDRGRQVPIEAFDFDLPIELTPPAKLFEQTIDRVTVSPDCSPRPGPLAREASIDVTVGKELVIKVVTVPSNAEIETCVTSDLMKRLVQFAPGVWRFHSQRTVPIPVRFTDERLAINLRLAGPDYTKRCAPAGLGKPLTITASAKRDDTTFTIGLDAGDAAFQRCFRDLLQNYLRTANGGYRLKSDGTPEPYFRIDATVRATFTVPKP